MFKAANRRYWVGTVSREHGLNAVKEGIVQVCHGKKAPLERINKGDWFIYYSPREEMSKKSKSVQRFICIGKVKTGDVYQVEQFPGFKPFRIDVEFMKVEEISIRPLINDLDFINSKKSWGMAFRYGCREISEKDFLLIAKKMGLDLSNPVPANSVSDKNAFKI